MSNTPSKRSSIPALRARKNTGDSIVVLTAYDYTTAKLLDQHDDVDCILVGGSLGMVVLGYPDTTAVTMDDMLHHVKAVRRGCQRALVIADMPFGSVTCDDATALRNITQMMQDGRADCVKLEGASAHICNIISHVTQHGIPVMGHLGFTPQSVQSLGGFTVQAKTMDAVKQLIIDAKALEQAGAFALVLEMVPWQVAQLITQLVGIPTIGIGAGQYCDGQVLVIDDFMGRYPDFKPRFARRYLEEGQALQAALTQFKADIQAHQFPSESEAFSFPSNELDALTALAQAYGQLSLGSESTREVTRA